MVSQDKVSYVGAVTNREIRSSIVQRFLKLECSDWLHIAQRNQPGSPDEGGDVHERKRQAADRKPKNSGDYSLEKAFPCLPQKHEERNQEDNATELLKYDDADN